MRWTLHPTRAKMMAISSRHDRRQGVRMKDAWRDSETSTWLAELAGGTGGHEPYLVRRSSGGLFVIDQDRRRAVSSGLLAAALEQRLGQARVVEPDELQRWQEGPPVELLSAPDGRPFVVIGGRRWRVRGFPAPHAVATEDMQRFDEGPDLDVAGANVSRTRFENAVSGQYHVDRVRTVIAREGPLKGAGLLARRAAQRIRRLFG
jgi:hypothetical protein